MRKAILIGLGLVAAVALVGAALVVRDQGSGPGTSTTTLSDGAGATEPATTPASGTPTPPRNGSAFTVGVWLQDPAGNAKDYKEMGVNTFVGLWNWPNDGDAYPGWAKDSLDALAREDLVAYGGLTPTAVRQTLSMKHNKQVVGWMAGDEPDMQNVTPEQWTQNIEAMKAVEDRPVYGNFGQGFSGFDWWYGHLTDETRAAYCAPVDIASFDFYGMTNQKLPETPEHRGPWTYGRGVDNLEKACPGKPTWAFVEVTEPSPVAKAATPEGIRAAAWNAIVHGADGLEYFIHDFNCNPECGPSAFLYEDRWKANREAVKDLNAELHRYDAVLTSPDVEGVASSTGIPLTLLAKRVDGTTYVFAQADGSDDRFDGYSGRATVTVDGHTFTDTWKPYQVRVYTVR
jgi:hypothetical protein